MRSIQQIDRYFAEYDVGAWLADGRRRRMAAGEGLTAPLTDSASVEPTVVPTFVFYSVEIPYSADR